MIDNYECHKNHTTCTCNRHISANWKSQEDIADGFKHEAGTCILFSLLRSCMYN